jgi:transcriptional regulator with XRE-family HTH domain
MDNTLGDFLRTRRAAIQPEEVGLPPYGRRRVPGLRREEVAQLAGVSVDYYVRLEQGRGPNVSDAVLDAVARVLRLDPTERAHLRTLARPPGGAAVAPAAAPAKGVRPGVRRLLDAMADCPAMVIDHRMDVLACNALADALHGLTAHPLRRSMPRLVFLDPAASDLFPEWAAVAAETVAHLRLGAGRHPDDPHLTALVGELSVKSPAFRALWADHRVREKSYGVKRIHHPVAGALDLAYETLALPSDPDQVLVVYTPPPNPPSAHRLPLLHDPGPSGPAG